MVSPHRKKGPLGYCPGAGLAGDREMSLDMEKWKKKKRGDMENEEPELKSSDGKQNTGLLSQGAVITEKGNLQSAELQAGTSGASFAP